VNATAAVRAALGVVFATGAATVAEFARHRPILGALAALGCMAALLAAVFASLARASSVPRPHPPGCTCGYDPARHDDPTE
jgi:hypothetical protein